ETTSGISGREIVLAVVDGGRRVSDVLNDMEKLCVSEKVDMATVYNARISEKARPIFVKYKVPHMDASNCQTILRPPASYTYRPFGSAVLDCYAILQYIQMIHEGAAPPRIGILTANDACGKSIHGPSEAYASNHRLEIVSVEQFTPGTKDLKPAMLKLKGVGAEYIFMQCAPSDAVTALKSS
ncbi:MAG: ABC transporter substrate-binding protein, partial [Deltaproteobacteria bacterium]|nr:ABC transporter substrate-binding protein [Deltaproteobacteria bacterium]